LKTDLAEIYKWHVRLVNAQCFSVVSTELPRTADLCPRAIESTCLIEAGQGTK